MSAILPPAESRRVSSKCWRQVPVTLSLLGGLDATEVCALGNRLEKAPHGQSAMPWRYHRAKIKQATILKHQLKFVLKELIFDQSCSSWDSADAESIRASFKRAHKVVAAELAEAPELVYQWRGAHCMTGEQAFRLRCSSSAWLPQGSAGSSTEGARLFAGLSNTNCVSAQRTGPRHTLPAAVPTRTARTKYVLPYEAWSPLPTPGWDSQ